MQTYTSPNGSTVPGQQVDQTMQTAAMNAASGNFAALPSDDSLSQMASSATSQLGAMQTPQARQGYLDNSTLPSMQSNYENLARQLYDVDKAIAASGKFNATPAPDATQGFGVEASPLELTSSILGKSGFNPINPEFGMRTQIANQNNVVDLLNILNSAIGKEFSSRKNTYASTVSAQRDVLNSILKVMGLKQDAVARQADLDMRKQELAMRYADRADAQKEKQISKFFTEAQKAKSSFLAGKNSTGNPRQAWGQIFDNIKTLSRKFGVSDEVTDEDINDFLEGGWNPQTGETWGNATPEALDALYLKGRPVAQQNAVPGLEAAVSNIKSARDEYNRSWTKGTAGILSGIPGIGPWLASTIDKNAYNYVQNVQGVLSTQVAKGIGGDVGALANKDIERAQRELADVKANPQVGKERLDKAVMHATQAVMRVTRKPITVINPKSGQKVQVDTADELETVFNRGYTLIQ